MENRKFVKILSFIVFGFLLLGVKSSFAYGVDTHALLTRDAAEFYSQKVATSSANNLQDYLIDGARKEDDVPRWMNHFYDPVYDRGLTMDSKIDPFYVLGNWNKSKDWVVGSDLQKEIKYKAPTVVASILTAIQQRKLSSLTAETDFTWNEALYFWINGEKEKAMFTLGHVLHLIQDASVPDHTRNDPHPEGSIYEKWAGQFTLNNPDNNLLPKLVGRDLVNFDNLGSYFDELSRYSNNNFYSKDTIGIQSGYDFPEIEGVEKNGDYYYGYKRDGIGNIYYVSVYKNYRGSLVIGTSNNIGLKIEDEDKVISNYWSLLSPKAVQYSASAINFFFKEAERLKDDPQFAKRESFFAQVIDVTRGIVSVITDAAKNIVSIAKESSQIPDQNLLASISLNEKNDGVNKNNDTVQLSEQEIIGPSLVTQLVGNNDVVGTNKSDETNKSNIKESVAEEDEINLKQGVAQEIISSSTQEKLLNKVPEVSTVQEPIIQTCSFQTTKIPTRQKLLINEVAWMGSIKSSSDEWIELKNISGSELDISNWQILDKEEQIKITFPKDTKILAGGFLLLERTDDNSVFNVGADIIYIGALSNSNEGLRLFDNECGLIDEVLASSEWPAGDAPTKRTMERQADMTWWTYNGAGEGSGDSLILGTPKKENTVRVIYYGGGGGSTAIVPVVETVNDSNNQPSKLLISEIQITGGTGKSNNDFVEIYNPNEGRVNLKGYRLVKRTKTGTTDTGIKSWTDDVYVEAKSFYLWANSDYSDISVIPDITTSGSLANDNGIALRFGAEDTGTIVDSVAWGLAENSFIGTGVFLQNPGAGQSIQRKLQNNLFIDTDNNTNDFELTVCPNPKVQSRFCAVGETNESNQAPSAFFVFSTTTPKIGEEIIFDAASSTDSDGNIALYDWNFGDNQLASSTQATTTHNYLLAGDFDILLTVFDNLNATSTYALSLSVASSTIQQGIVEQNEESEHVLISEVMAGLGSGRSDEEFIELYNPTLEEINLSGYSLKRRASILSTTTQNLVRSEDFASTTIKANSFLLIASKEYLSGSTPDIYYSNSSYHSAYSDEAIVLYNNFNEIVDEIEYEIIDEGKSLERMALSSGICVSAQSDGEFLGNGCDTDNNEGKFEIRDIPNPQNKNNFPEPRNKPITVTNFIGEYDKVNKKIILSWDASRDYSGATSTLSYLISDISSNSVLGRVNTASTTVEFNIIENNRDYVFEIEVIDKEGLSSDASTVAVFAPCISIEEVNYLILNQNEILSSSEGTFGQVFKPLASGINESVTLNLVNTIQHGGFQGISSVDISLYEWIGASATTSPNIGKGQLLAKSSPREFYANTSGNYVWSFDSANQILLDATKYYYLQVNIIPTQGDLSLIWGLSSASGASDKALYAIIKAVENGSVIINNPVNNYIYQNIDINFTAKYSEPFKNKYSNLVVDVRDFYTEELVNSQTITLNDNQKVIGWHEITGNLNINRSGYFKLKISLSELSKSEIYFSVFGTVPVEGKLLNQTAFVNNLSGGSVAQSFRPVIGGKLDSIVLKLSTGGNGWNYTSLKIYEWVGGQSNSSTGTKGQLLATSESKMFWNNSAVGDPVDFTWQFNDDNEINLNSNNYYYLESVIDSQSNGGAPGFFFRGSNNDSLIDGKIYSGNIGGDLYMIINAKSGL